MADKKGSKKGKQGDQQTDEAPNQGPAPARDALKAARDATPASAKGETVEGQPGTGGDTNADVAPETVGDGPSGGAAK